MKRLIFIMAALIASVTIGIAQNTSDIPFKAESDQLTTYLKLRPDQKKKVKTLNESFIQKQQASYTDASKMQEALSENLSGMKDVLSKAQFEKYVALLSGTNKNKNVIAENLFTDLVSKVDK